MAWVVVLVVVALVPLLLATWTFGRTYRTSEIGQVDARLSATEGSVAADVEATGKRTSRVAVSAARSPSLQRALLRGEKTRLVSRPHNRDVHLAAGPGSLASPVPRASISRTAIVRAGHRLIGHVTAWVSLPEVLSRLSAKTEVETVALVDGRVVAGRLRGSALTTPAGTAHAVRLGSRRYRVLRQPLGRRGVSAVLLVPYAKIESTVFHREVPTIVAGAVTLVALGLLAALTLPRVPLFRKRADAGDWRRPVALVGDVAVAAHDPDALLPVILETALVATDADGGAIVWEGDEIASLGITSQPRRILALSLGDESHPDAGQLLLYRRHAFSARDREMAESLVAQGRIALENARLHDLVRRQAQTDELTDLANRRRFMNGLEQEIARSGRFATPLSLVLFDLDRFKRVNDHCGHQIGDLVLRGTADVVRARIRGTDLAARVGGEEFAVLLPGSDASGAARFADNLRRDIQRDVVVEGVRWPTTASFGVAQFRTGMSIEILVGAADRALYQAKAAGRNRVRAADDVDPDNTPI